MSSTTDLVKSRPPQTDRPSAAASGRALLARYRNVLVPIVALVVLVAYFGIKNSTFVILIGGIDLSVAANATLAGILIAKWVDSMGGTLAIIMVVLVGGLVGLVNGVVATVLKVPSFLVTLGMMSVLDGVSNRISSGGPVSYTSGLLQQLINETLFPGIPNGALIAFILVIGFTVKLLVFTLAGMIAAIAGIILTGQASTGVPLGADPSLLDSIAAIVVGGTALSGGVGGPHRTLLGALVIVILTSGMDITSVDPYNQLIVKGAVVILAVAATIDRRRYGLIK